MEDGSSFDYTERQTMIFEGGTNLLFAGSLGAILILLSRIPTMLLIIEMMNNVIPGPTITLALMFFVGELIALVGVIFLGLGIMMLMKRYGKTYGPILFLAVIAPFLMSLFIPLQITTPGQYILSGLFNSIVSIVTSIIIGIALLIVRTQSVNPNITGITGILNIANPLVYMLSGLVPVLIEDLSIAYPIYLLTFFIFSFIVYVLFSILFYMEARSSVIDVLDW
jgi:hypothetical protein